MLLLLEIGLTILVCVKYSQAKLNWALGLIPLAVALLGAVLLGVLFGIAGANQESMTCVGVLVDLGVVGYLIYLATTIKPKE